MGTDSFLANHAFFVGLDRHVLGAREVDTGSPDRILVGESIDDSLLLLG
jgi:hypothetical protein